ncbi:hypothetical protein LX36DRAFT_668423 [Colletotrichum falcatum]|nr:hypothetical protein LX36DRAFT_668423 [Colletotrichum falcatum]
MPLSQLLLSLAILASTAGTYVGLRNPNPEPPSSSSSSAKPNEPPRHADSIRWMLLTHRHASKVILLPLAFLSLHLAALALYHRPGGGGGDALPAVLLRHGAVNGLSAAMTTWSASTALPLALVLGVGVPLRLGPYRSLGSDFTFQLSRPARLKTTGIYARVQHPSYVGVVVLVLSNVALLARPDGVLACWIPPPAHRALRAVEWVLAPAACSVFLLGVWTRVREEERMLKAEFGDKWERWHASTARFIPYVL